MTKNKGVMKVFSNGNGTERERYKKERSTVVIYIAYRTILKDSTI